MKKTQRGFTIYGEFKDTKKQIIRVQQSSAACVEAVWVFATNPQQALLYPWDYGAPTYHPHLNRTQAKRLIKALTKFVEGP